MLSAEPERLPHRLIREARRNAGRLQLAVAAQVCGAGIAVGRWFHGELSSVAVAGAVLTAAFSVVVTEMLYRRQLRRAAWLAGTSRWWERLDELPRMEPFPRVVDFLERRIPWRAFVEQVARLSPAYRDAGVGRALRDQRRRAGEDQPEPLGRNAGPMP